MSAQNCGPSSDLHLHWRAAGEQPLPTLAPVAHYQRAAGDACPFGLGKKPSLQGAAQLLTLDARATPSSRARRARSRRQFNTTSRCSDLPLTVAARRFERLRRKNASARAPAAAMAAARAEDPYPVNRKRALSPSITRQVRRPVANAPVSMLTRFGLISGHSLGV